MSLDIRPAVKQGGNPIICLWGVAGSGKTYSLLRLARGLSEDGKFLFADTEARRALFYGDKFQPWDHVDFKPPYAPDRFIEIIQAAQAANYRALIIDSFSHEWEGTGGIIEWADSLNEKFKGSAGKWAAPKAAHKRMVNALVNATIPILIGLRAREKIKMEKGVKEPIELGLQPICEDNLFFEATVVAQMDAATKRPILGKTIEGLADLFPKTRHITEEDGKRILEWAKGGKPPPVAAPKAPAAPKAARDPEPAPTAPTTDDFGEEPPPESAVERAQRIARDVAFMGTDALRRHYASLVEADRGAVKLIQAELFAAAREADDRAAETAEALTEET